ncbi:MAG: protein-L-isoaspartate(D-aspartate) O-methyltransferase [Deltaproteobacteria bacterium]|nr:protein-L-isoaspartate(D-aspartate) O-methyltransferase [Deltaproteobacteria bacterium]
MMDDASKRARMVARQIEARGVRDARVLQAMREVPRHVFVPAALAESACDDRALPIAAGQTISQPYVVALMLEALALRPADRVLEVGTGSGYAAALLSRLAAEVYTIERHAELGELARERLAELGCANVRVRIADGTLGWPEAAPFDAILVSAGGPRVPASLEAQLAVGGRLVIPVGAGRGSQQLLRVVRTAGDRLEREDLGDVQFVPLVGAEGWDETPA